jgi:hypothetical protein
LAGLLAIPSLYTIYFIHNSIIDGVGVVDPAACTFNAPCPAMDGPNGRLARTNAAGVSRV